ncbi:MAG: ABC transporter ATP-binding protein [Selenomonadales bacterium]|nr:ABC transporter ATP-binding protein [Selenomonadales bacterium]MBQ2246042.1 ABC transporter ATP-binding protein [Selenomonadales bacterium]
MIKLIDLNMEYGERIIMRDVNLTIKKGETLAVVGPSGTGKSTLLKLLIGLARPTSGQVWVDGKEISRLKEKELDEARLGMGMVFQYSALFDSMSVGENVAFGLRQHTDMKEDEIRRVVEERLAGVGLAGLADAMPNELSGGMKKRVGLARALAFKPNIILYDEPSSGLDPIMSRKIDELILETQKNFGVTSVVVTHDMESAYRIADRIAVLYEGRFVQIGTPDEIRRSDHPYVQEFVRAASYRKE